jgi:hypothetical protein
LTSAWPFSGYFVAGLFLLVIVGGGCLVAACIAAFNERAGWIAGLLMGCVLVGWIGGELIFMSQTMVMTWIILGAGLALIALSAPFALPELRRLITHRAGTKAFA